MNSIAEFASYITPDGVEYKLDYGKERWVMTDEGTGMPPINYITQSGFGQHGSTVIDFRLQPRVIQIQIRSESSGRENYWSSRSSLLKVLRPNRQNMGMMSPGHLLKKFSDGSKLQLDVFIQQGPAFTARSLSKWDEWGFIETIRFIAYDPIFYNPIPKIYNWSTLGQSSSDLSFPTTFPITFGESVINIMQSIAYVGSWMSFPSFVITGPAINPSFINFSTNNILSLDYEISSGEIVYISLEPGNKTIVNNLGADLMGSLTFESDITSFHLAPDPEVSEGINDIIVTAGGLTNESSAVMTYYERHIGY